MTPMFRALEVRNYRLYFGGQVLSNAGTWMQRVAQDWLVLTVLTDHSSTALGIVTGLQFLPYLLFSLWGGTLADREGTEADQGDTVAGLEGGLHRGDGRIKCTTSGGLGNIGRSGDLVDQFRFVHGKPLVVVG